MDSLINVGNEDAPQMWSSLDNVSANDGPDPNPHEVNFTDFSSRISNNAGIKSCNGDEGTGRETNNTNKCISKRVAKRIRNLQAKFINTIMTSFRMYVSVSWGAVIKKI